MKGKAALISILLLLCVGFCVEATNITYDNVPSGDYKVIDTSSQEHSGLASMYNMAVGFVNLVFKPFSDVEDIFMDILSDFDKIAENFQANLSKLLKFETGYLVCVAFGIVFVVLVVVGGLITFCCRCCCSGCGGEYVQTVQRTKSGWRSFYAGILFVLTVMITLPCIFIYLTNSWLTQIIDQAPTQFNDVLDNVVKYAEVLPDQLQHTVDEFTKLNSSIVDDLDNIDQTVGVPLRDEFKDFAKPAIQQLENVDAFVNGTLTSIGNVEVSINKIESDYKELDQQLKYLSKDMESGLNVPECTGVSACNELRDAAVDLGKGNVIDIDTTQVQTAEDELKKVNISEKIELVESTLDDIPTAVANLSTDATKDVVSTLNSASSELNKVLTVVNQSTIDSIVQQVEGAKNISTRFEEISDEVDSYRLIACAVIGGCVLSICVLYFFGLLLGQCNYDPNPELRGPLARFGGILLMSGVGFSFLFSWILMILTIVLFTVGGHGERWICQSIEAPFYGLKFADKLIDESTTLNGLTFENTSLSIYELVESCEENKSIYNTLHLEDTLNLTEITGQISEKLSDFTNSLSNLTVDLSNLDVYNNDTKEALESLTTSGIEGVDLDGFMTTINDQMKDADFLEFSQNITKLSSDMRAFNNTALADKLDAYAANLTDINTTYYTPIEAEVETLETHIDTLQSYIEKTNATVNETSAVLEALNTKIQTEGPEEVSKQLVNLGNNLVVDVNGYISWLEGQIRNEVGACRPLYNVYDQAVTTVCTYMMDVLGGLWFSLGWSVFFLMPAAIVAMKLSKFYRGGRLIDVDDEYTEELEMSEYTSLPQQKLVHYR